MARPRKKKVEVGEQPADGGLSVATDSAAAGGCKAASPGASQGSSDEPVHFTAREKKEMLAIAEYEAKSEHADQLRMLANNEELQQKNAQRLYNYKIKRLDAGDKRDRRKSSFRAACRSYEAVIALLEAQHKCEWSKCRAAEAETAAANAKIRLLELE